MFSVQKAIFPYLTYSLYMTKSQTFYYIGAVILITLAAYLYTSVVEAPHAPDNQEVETINESTNLVEESTSTISSTENQLAKPTTTIPISLIGTSWRWLRTENATGTIASEPKSDKLFILRFGEANSMGSKTDCNTIGGSYEITGDQLTFGPLMSTLMFCENSKETEYSAALAQVNSYFLVDNTLRLILDDGGTMFFVRTAQ
jgi:heat shock protein HslJ